MTIFNNQNVTTEYNWDSAVNEKCLLQIMKVWLAGMKLHVCNKMELTYDQNNYLSLPSLFNGKQTAFQCSQTMKERQNFSCKIEFCGRTVIQTFQKFSSSNAFRAQTTLQYKILFLSSARQLEYIAGGDDILQELHLSSFDQTGCKQGANFTDIIQQTSSLLPGIVLQEDNSIV